jgi:hypothetical protein
MRITNDGNVGIGTNSPSKKLTVNGSTMIMKSGHSSGADDYHLELFSPNTGTEVSLRFHQSQQWYQQIRARNDGFHFTQGNNNSYRPIYTGTIVSNDNVFLTNPTTGTSLSVYALIFNESTSFGGTGISVNTGGSLMNFGGEFAGSNIVMNFDNGSITGAKFIGAINEVRNNESVLIWRGTQAQYDAIGTKSSITIYFITA